MMYKALKACTNFSSMVSNTVLKELCYIAQLDTWKEEDFPGQYKNKYGRVNNILKHFC